MMDIKKEEFEEYYSMHSQKSTCEHFNITQYTFNKYIKEFNIQKHSQAETIRLGCLEKYGVDNPFQISATKDKIKQTKIEKYNNPTYHNIEKTKQTNLEKYGSESPLGNEEIINKSKKTLNEHYGVDNPFKSDEIKQKIKDTKQERYGDDTYTNRELCIKTLLEKYGIENPSQIEELKEQRFKSMIETNLKKYGVPYYVMTTECTNANGGRSSESIPNKAFRTLLIDNNIEYTNEFTLKNYSYDFKVNNILIEINPFATHNSTWGIFNNPKEKHYHFNKTKVAIENGYRCINIWDWDNIDKIISFLKPKEHLYARQLEVREITKDEIINEFETTNHIQGYCKGQTICLGLYLGDKLIELMTFGKPRYNRHYEYELLRLCTDFSYTVTGGANKLYKYFIENYNPNSIISYCDNSKFDGKVYENLGFTLLSYGAPSKHWYNPNTQVHITDNLLRQRGFDQLFGKEYGCFGKGTSNDELMLTHDFVEIYDCGQKTFIWAKDKG